MEEARTEELAYMKANGIYAKVPVDTCWAETGKAPLSLRWVDTNKGDDEHEVYRSRLVVRELRVRNTTLSASDLFAAMPPYECLKLMISLWVSLRFTSSGTTLKLGLWDVKKAHLYGQAERRVFTDLPAGDEVDGFCALLLRGMYGTQDASGIWQRDYTGLMESDGWAPGVASPATFFQAETTARALSHGDDFAVLADDAGLERFDRLLRTRYEVKRTALMGPDPGEDCEAIFLNRIIRYYPEEHEVELEADSRHADLIVSDLGLEGSKPVATPSVKMTSDEAEAAAMQPEVCESDKTLYRSVTMRGSYFGQDRPDIQETIKTRARKMQAPTAFDLQALKRLGRYLRSHRRGVFRFRRQRMPTHLTIEVDTDHAGCKLTRKSTVGLAALLGRHACKTLSVLESCVSLSSGESEFYGIVKAACEGLGLQAILRDWGVEVQLKIRSDSSAARAIGNRRGLGRVRHLDTRFLWVQERIALKHFCVEAVSTEENTGDLFTKSLPAPRVHKLLAKLGFSFVGGSSGKERQLIGGGGPKV